MIKEEVKKGAILYLIRCDAQLLNVSEDVLCVEKFLGTVDMRLLSVDVVPHGFLGHCVEQSFYCRIHRRN